MLNKDNIENSQEYQNAMLEINPILEKYVIVIGIERKCY